VCPVFTFIQATRKFFEQIIFVLETFFCWCCIFSTRPKDNTCRHANGRLGAQTKSLMVIGTIKQNATIQNTTKDVFVVPTSGRCTWETALKTEKSDGLMTKPR